MSESDFEGEDIGDLAHDLYWSSDRSVNSIAEELGLSKGGLYQHILPIPATGECPRCGGGVGYFNRTARDRDEPTCLALCDNEESFPVGGTAALLAARRNSRRDGTGGSGHTGASHLHYSAAERPTDEAADLEDSYDPFGEDFIDDHPLRERPSPRFLEKLRSPLSRHEKKVVAGALLACAAGLFLLRLARR